MYAHMCKLKRRISSIYMRFRPMHVFGRLVYDGGKKSTNDVLNYLAANWLERICI
jgi:hypothetical protein